LPCLPAFSPAMHSPFFWRNVGVLLLLCGGFVLCLLWLRRQRRWRKDGVRPSLLHVTARGLALLCFGISILALCIAILLFIDLELSDRAQTVWKKNRDWPRIRVGMTQAEVAAILGEPDDVTFATEEGAMQMYRLHPYGFSLEGCIEFASDPMRIPLAPRVKEQDPSANAATQSSTDWFPVDSATSMLRDASVMAAIFSTLGIALLALAAILPFGRKAEWTSWTLYTPLLAGLFAALYEHAQSGGWRFDLFLLYPAYTIIVLGWLVRVIRCYMKWRSPLAEPAEIQ